VNEREIFVAAFQELDPAARVALLDRACGPDGGLRNRVEALLRNADAAGSFLEHPALADADTATDRTCPERPADTAVGLGTAVGPYTLVEVIGEGGMGTVYLAEQSAPVQRRVALKLIKPGMDSRSVLARFDAERQALALMDHPNIAKVFDGGAAASDRPFFVMELVPGVPVTQFCDEKQLTVRQRLGLFLAVCRAVQHAHQKGVIHRDLKPSNILVAAYDGVPTPKVIDFGVAKATDQRLTDQTLTAFGTIVGTPEYMSPEQAEPGQVDVDTRSDVYSLGVILYELLTGTTPLERGRVRDVALLEVLRLIREEEPPTPSTRLGTTTELPAIAANRGLEPKKLSGLVRGELDWIAMKGLEKDRSRRYESASALAIDLERYLADEPVSAGPPSARYRVRKFVRRNKVPVIAAAVVLVSLVAGSVGAAWGLVKSRVAERDALQAQRAEAERAEGETKAKQAAQARLAQIEKGNEILAAIFADLNPRAEHELRRPLRAILGERLAKAAAQLEGEAIGDPTVVAMLQMPLGRSLVNLGLPDPAVTILEKARATLEAALGPEHEMTLTAANDLGTAYWAAGKNDLAQPIFEATLRVRVARLGPEHRETLTSMNNVALALQVAGKPEQALPLLETCHRVFVARYGFRHADSVTMLNNLALGHQAVGRVDRALPMFKEALELRAAQLGPDHPDTLQSMNDLAVGYKAAGMIQQSVSLHEQTLKLRKAKLGDEHPDTLLSMANLGEAYLTAGRLDRALPRLEEAVKLQKERNGEDHADTLNTMNNLAAAYRADRRLDLAVPLFETSLKLRTAKFGADHPDALLTVNNLASCYIDAKKSDLALPLLEGAYKRQKERHGADDSRTLATLNNLAVAYKAAGRLGRALPLYEEVLVLRRARLGDGHPDTLLSMSNLAMAYHDDGQPGRALPLLREAASGVEKLQFMDEHAARICHNLINCLERLKQDDQAEVWRRKWLDVVRQQSGANSLAYASELVGLGRNLLGQKKWSDAEAVLRETHAIRENLDRESWRTFNTKTRLGVALMGQNKHAEAEPLLRAGYLGMKERATTIPEQLRSPVLADAIAQLVRLYQETDRPDEAAKWRRELEAHRK
jgi:serine/threonine protein kinase/tetratricopeptide (TPR) repeat protein